MIKVRQLCDPCYPFTHANSLPKNSCFLKSADSAPEGRYSEGNRDLDAGRCRGYRAIPPSLPEMNILFLTHQGDMAGSTYSISFLARGLAARGHHIYVGARRASLLFSLFEGTRVTLIPMTFKSSTDLANMRQIRDAVRTYDIQIVNPQSSKDRYTSILAKRLFGLKYRIVFTRRQRSRSFGGWLHTRLIEANTSRIVAVSEGVKRSLMSKGFRENHIKVIPNGMPMDKFKTIDPSYIETLRKQFDIREGDFVVGCIARRKQQEQLLEALNDVKKPLKMIFVGMPQKAEWVEIENAITVPHQIWWVGVVPLDKVLNYYFLFDIHVLPSVAEGLSQTLLETFYLGIPNIATEAAGNIDLIEDGVNGLFFKEGETKKLASLIERLRDDPALREKLVAGGKETVKDYPIERTVERFEAFFESLLRGS